MRVIIIGAGLAGLVSGRELQRRGYQVVLLEARNRVGGRVYTVREGFAGGMFADVGAEIIYSWNTEIVRLCEELGIELTPPTSLGTAIPTLLFDGRRLEPEQAQAVARELQERHSSVPPAPFESIAAWARRARVSDWGYRLLEAVVQGTPVTPIRQADAAELNPEISWGEGYRQMRGGNDQLPRRLAEELDVRLGRWVTRIDWSGPAVKVTTTAGEEHEADIAIVAVPGPLTTELGFDPPLPPAKIIAGNSLRYGNGARLVLQYAERELIEESIAGGAFTDRTPGWMLNQSARRQGEAAILSSVLGGDHEPRLRSEAEVLEAADRTIRALAGAPVTRLHGIVYDWSGDPLTRCIVREPVGDQRETVLPVLAAPLGGRLFFAGEHTDDRVGPGGMEGAIRSAYRVVRDIEAARAGAEPTARPGLFSEA